MTQDITIAIIVIVMCLFVFFMGYLVGRDVGDLDETPPPPPSRKQFPEGADGR
jgi:hypothetical protein